VLVGSGPGPDHLEVIKLDADRMAREFPPGRDPAGSERRGPPLVRLVYCHCIVEPIGGINRLPAFAPSRRSPLANDMLEPLATRPEAAWRAI